MRITCSQFDSLFPRTYLSSKARSSGSAPPLDRKPSIAPSGAAASVAASAAAQPAAQPAGLPAGESAVASQKRRRDDDDGAVDDAAARAAALRKHDQKRAKVSVVEQRARAASTSYV